jgi:hypothetical protein
MEGSHEFEFVILETNIVMRLRAVVIILIIIASLIPVYSFNKYLQKAFRPRESLGRLMGYLLAGLVLIFAYTFLLVFFIRKLFPTA